MNSSFPPNQFAQSADIDPTETADWIQSLGSVAQMDGDRRARFLLDAIGDVVGQPTLAHKAVHQGHVAAGGGAGHKAGFDATVVPAVACVDPEIAWAGITETDAQANAISIEVAKFPWAASGRAIANGAEYGQAKLIFLKESGRIIGGAIVGPNAGDMIGEVCLAIELGADAIDIRRTIHPHPTLGETIGMAAEVASWTCADLPGKAGRRH